jgi:hypothetical protein
MILKLKNVHDVLPSLQNLMEEESIVVDELTLFASNMKKGVCVVLESFLSFLRKFEKNKVHNILFVVVRS